MQINCSTIQAAAQVVQILLIAELRPIRDFAIRPVFSTTPPITITLLVVLTAAQVTKIHAVAGTTIVG